MAETEGLGAKPGQPGPEGHRPEAIADTPMSALPEDDGKLCRRLRQETRNMPQGFCALVNPDGPEAATRIETLSREIERLRGNCSRARDACDELLDRVRAETLEVAAKAFRAIDERLWATHGSSNAEALIACLKEIETIVKPFLSTGSAALGVEK